MSLNEYVNYTCKKTFYQLMQLKHLKNYMSEDTTFKLTHAFIHSYLDYLELTFVQSAKLYD